MGESTRLFCFNKFAVLNFSVSWCRWAKSKDAEAVEKTEEVFQRMKSMFESGNEEARPNLFSFVTLVNCITKSGGSGAAERAESIIFEMHEQYKNGNTDVKPNTQLVSSVIDSWQKSGGRDAGERAEALLNWLIGVYKEEGDEELRPNEFSFTSGKQRIKYCTPVMLSWKQDSLIHVTLSKIQRLQHGQKHVNSARLLEPGRF
jgi:hypothetical protein